MPSKEEEETKRAVRLEGTVMKEKKVEEGKRKCLIKENEGGTQWYIFRKNHKRNG